MSNRDEVADQTYKAADIGNCQKVDGSNWTQEDFREKVKRDEVVHGHHAQRHMENMVEKDNGDNDWDKVNHFSSVAVNENKQRNS